MNELQMIELLKMLRDEEIEYEEAFKVVKNLGGGESEIHGMYKVQDSMACKCKQSNKKKIYMSALHSQAWMELKKELNTYIPGANFTQQEIVNLMNDIEVDVYEEANT